MASVSAVNCVFLVCLCMGLVSYADSKCPRNPEHGYWDEDTDRCILRCNGGYEPSGCHIIRYNSWTEKWNRDIPSCQEEWPGSGKTLMVVGTGVTVVATPVLLAGAGFTAAGVAARSIAAMLQIPFAPRRWFPKPWSVDVIGTGFSICEEE